MAVWEKQTVNSITAFCLVTGQAHRAERRAALDCLVTEHEENEHALPREAV